MPGFLHLDAADLHFAAIIIHGIGERGHHHKRNGEDGSDGPQNPNDFSRSFVRPHDTNFQRPADCVVPEKQVLHERKFSSSLYLANTSSFAYSFVSDTQLQLPVFVVLIVVRSLHGKQLVVLRYGQGEPDVPRITSCNYPPPAIIPQSPQPSPSPQSPPAQVKLCACKGLRTRSCLEHCITVSGEISFH